MGTIIIIPFSQMKKLRQIVTQISTVSFVTMGEKSSGEEEQSHKPKFCLNDETITEYFKITNRNHFFVFYNALINLNVIGIFAIMTQSGTVVT